MKKIFSLLACTFLSAIPFGFLSAQTSEGSCVSSTVSDLEGTLVYSKLLNDFFGNGLATISDSDATLGLDEVVPGNPPGEYPLSKAYGFDVDSNQIIFYMRNTDEIQDDIEFNFEFKSDNLVKINCIEFNKIASGSPLFKMQTVEASIGADGKTVLITLGGVKAYEDYDPNDPNDPSFIFKKLVFDLDTTVNSSSADTSPPIITLVTFPNKAAKVGETITATITVESDADIYTLNTDKTNTINGYALNNLTKTNDTTYTATFTVTDGGEDKTASSDIDVSLSLSDSAGNNSAVFTDPIRQDSDTIFANLPNITLETNTNALTEDGSSATLTANIADTLNNMWPENIIVNLSYSGTATGSGKDYTSSSMITIASGNSSGNLSITSVDDTLYDALVDETIIVDISSASAGRESGEQQVTITLIDEETPPTVTLSVGGSPSIAESGGASGITATLSHATFEDVTVSLGYSGTAIGSGTDYNSPSASITIPAGSTSANATAGIISVDDHLAEGNETVVLDITRVSGGGASEKGTQQQTVTIVDDEDTTPPIKPTITMPIEGDNRINATEAKDVLIAGTDAEAGATVRVFIDSEVQVVIADAQGAWTLSGQEMDLSSVADNTALQISVTQTDAAGNTSDAATASVILDKTVNPITISGKIGNNGVVNALLANATDSLDVLSGTSAEPGATITISLGNQAVGTTTADNSGNWTVAGIPKDLLNGLSDGQYTVSVTQTDVAGNESTNETTSFTLDTTAPILSEITAVKALGNDNTPNTTLNISEAGNLNVSGSCGSGSEGAITAGNQTITLTQTDSHTALSDGNYSDCTVTVTDAAGNISSPLALSSFQVDTSAPAEPSIDTLGGFVNATDASALIIRGSGAEPGSTVTVTIDSLNRKVTADNNGNWTLDGHTLDLSGLDDGDYTIAVTQTDGAGNVSTSETELFTLDTSVDQPEITTPIEGDGRINAAEAADVLIAGTNAEANANVTVTIADQTKIVIADTDGTWTLAETEFDLTSVADNDNLVVSVTQTDEAGNSSTAATETVILDKTLPDGVEFAGNISGDGFVNAAEFSSFIIRGIGAEPNSIVTLIVGTATHQVEADNEGKWSLNGSGLNLADGEYTVTVTQTDSAGNTSDTSVVSSFQVDTAKPTLSETTAVAELGNDSTPNVVLTLSEAGTLEVEGSCGRDNDGTMTAGSQTITLTQADHRTPLSDGTYSDCTATLTDLAGNTSLPLNLTDFQIDTVKPVVSESTAVVAIGNDSTPNVTLTISKAGDLNVGGRCGSFNEGAMTTGAQTITLTQTDNLTPLSDGSYNNCTVTITDAAGNVSEALVLTSFFVDTSIPNELTITTPIAGDNRINKNEAASVTIRGTGAEANARVSVTIGRRTRGVTADAQGNWVLDGIDLSSESDNPSLRISASQTNAAGTRSPSTRTTVVLDTSPPNHPEIRIDQTLITTHNQTALSFRLAGLEVGGRFRYTLTDGTQIIEADWVTISDASQHVVDIDVSALASGTLTLNVMVEDGSGNRTEALAASVAKNDPPIAVDDDIVLNFNPNGRYLVDVLANDSDQQGSISLVHAKASLGVAAIVDGQLIYQVPTADNIGAISGETIEYSIEDSDGLEASATAFVSINVGSTTPPRIIVPETITVPATALYTRVELGVAAAEDGFGEPLPVTLASGSPFFPPGVNQAFWQATDALGTTAIVAQTVNVEPLINWSKNRTVIEGTSVTLSVILNGDSPLYPLSVPYSVSGTADNTDHTLESGVVVFDKGRETQITFQILQDNQPEPPETIVLTLDENVNRGAQDQVTITIEEGNIAPDFQLTLSQQEESRLIVSQEAGDVALEVLIDDPNPTDAHTIVWQSDSLDTPTDSMSAFTFDPTAHALGTHQIAVTVTDSGSPPKAVTDQITLQIVPTLIALSPDEDSDGDQIPDELEGHSDSDQDGIPDYQDGISDCQLLQESLEHQNRFIAESDVGTCLRLGQRALSANKAGALLNPSEQDLDKGAIEADSEATNIGGLFDFEIYGLPNEGESIRIVLPQRRPIPANAVYRKLKENNGWVNFVENDRNALSSAKGESGYCPPPSATGWEAGLVEGHWCVQLLIEDGGPNDDDGVANGRVVDPSGVATSAINNQIPEVTDESASLVTNALLQVDVLTNDSDPDGDTLYLSSVDADFGVASIEQNQVHYQAADEFIGTAIVTYGVSDGVGGTAFGHLILTISPNAKPTAQADQATVFAGQSITVDVLNNDVDPEEQILVITSVSTDQGEALISNNQLVFTAPNDFSGDVTVVYTINDGHGGEAQGMVTITVDDVSNSSPPNPVPETPERHVQVSSGGGALSFPWLLVLLSLGLYRRYRSHLKSAMSVILLLCSVNGHSETFIEGSIHNATANTDAFHSPDAALISMDNSDRGWSLGVSYRMGSGTIDSGTIDSRTMGNAWTFRLRYIDFGDTEAEYRLSGSTSQETLETLVEKSPALGQGIALDGAYSFFHYPLFQTYPLSVGLNLGTMFWMNEKHRTERLINTAQHNENAFFAFGGLFIETAFSPSLSLNLSAERFILPSSPDMTSLSVSVRYFFNPN